MVSTVDGLVSGLSTTSVIDQLMQVEAAGQTALKTRISKEQTTVSARLAVNSTVDGLLAAARSLTAPNTWSATAASSSSSTVTATAMPNASAGELVFDVDRTATAHTLVAGTSVTGPSATVATGPLTLTRSDGTTASVPVGDGSLSAVVSAINASNSGVRATAIQVSNGEYRLQLRAATTGAASTFTVAGLSPSLSMGVATAGQDARIIVNPGNPLSLTVTSASNTFRDVVPGLTFTVSAPATNVTVHTDQDVSGLADQVGRFVDAANQVLDTITQATAYDATKKVGGPLLGDSATRSLQQRLLDSFSGGVSSTSTSKAGVVLGRDGRLSFDRAAFTAAYAADPTATQALLARSSSVSGSVGGDLQVVGTADQTHEGSYDIRVTRAATRATATIATGPLAAADSVTLTLAGKTLTLAAVDGESTTDFAARLSSSARQVGMALGVSTDPSGLVVRADGYGSATALGVTTTGGLPPATSTAGLDVAGTIGGIAALGIGQQLTVTQAGVAPSGLALLVTLDPDEVTALAGGSAGSAKVVAGLGQRLASLAASATDPSTGTLITALDSERSRIDDMQEQVSAWDVRLALRRATLEHTYSQLEVALGSMKNQSTWLSGQIASLPSAG